MPFFSNPLLFLYPNKYLRKPSQFSSIHASNIVPELKKNDIELPFDTINDTKSPKDVVQARKKQFAEMQRVDKQVYRCRYVNSVLYIP